MTEEEWLACDDHHAIFEVIRRKASERKCVSMLAVAVGGSGIEWVILEVAALSKLLSNMPITRRPINRPATSCV